MLVIRLTRFGKKNKPFYRIVVAQKQAPITGKYIEKIGHFNPILNPPVIFVDKERAKKWMKNGAKPSDTVYNLFVSAGILKKKIVTKYNRKKKEKTKTEKSAAPAPQPVAATKEIPTENQEKPEKAQKEESVK